MALLAYGRLGVRRTWTFVHPRGSSAVTVKGVRGIGRRELFEGPRKPRLPQGARVAPTSPKKPPVQQKRVEPQQPLGTTWGTSVADLGPVPRYFYVRHVSTILKPQFSGATAWASLLSLTGLNVLVFSMWNSEEVDEDWMMDNFTTDITNCIEGRPWSLANASISHQTFPHIAGNMFAMWLFGFNTCRVIGPMAFSGLYLAGGLACSTTHVFHNILKGKTQPPLTKEERRTLEEMAQARGGLRNLPPAAAKRLATADMPSLGASGSVMAISGAAAALFPLDMVRAHPRGFYIPLPLAVCLFVLSDMTGLTQEGDPVDHAGHLGGMMMGIVYVTAAWYSKAGSFRILHNHPTGGQLPIIYRIKQMMRGGN